MTQITNYIQQIQLFFVEKCEKNGYFGSSKIQILNFKCIIIKKNEIVNGCSKSNLTHIQASPAKYIELMTDTTHLYVKLQHPGSKTEHTIKKIIGQRQSSFRKAIIYAATVPRARNIQNSLNKQAIVIVSQHDLKKRGERYLNFILQGKVLITNLRPNELFTLQQPKGVLNIGQVDLIINEKIPETKEQYFEKSNKLKNKDANRLTIISIAEQSQVARMSQSAGIQITEIYQKNQSQPTFRPPIGPPKNAMSGKSLSFQSPKANQYQNPETKKKSQATNDFFKRQNSSGKKSQKQQSRNRSSNNRLKTVSFNDQTLPVRRTDENKKRWIRSMVVGLNTKFTSCLQLELYAVYVDHTATNRPFKTIEDMVDHAKLYAANPHTEFSHFGQYSTGLMSYAKDSLLGSFNSPEGQYTVLPTGAGSTGAIEKAVSFLKIWEQNSQYQWKNPLIFVTPYQHHSNILPWVQFYPQGSIKQLAHDDKFTLNLKQVKRQISNCGAKCVIVSVSAASNVTSKLTRLKELNDLIKSMRTTKQKNIVFCVDCAAFCCHQQLDLQKYDQIDFAFLSPHKNLGGAESCGVLVARNNIINSSKPTFPGGGTVKFVKGYSREDVMYETGNFAREIAGTPPFFGFYRAALSFQLLTNRIGYEFIHDQQTKNTRYFFKRVEEQNRKLNECQIVIYGDTNLNERANVVTFNIVLQNDKTLQQNLVSRILNDVFGIQVRSGCFCAGPHGIKLLQLTQSNIMAIQQEVEAGLMTNKPGYVRLDLAFYLEQFEIQYIVSAISMIAKYWKNYERIYDLKKNGEIEVSVMKLPKKKMIYSLSDHEQARKIWKQHDGSIEEGLRNRKQNLLNQLQQAQTISKDPLTVLRTVRRN